MRTKSPRANALNRTGLSTAVAACFATQLASANPTAPTVVHGTAAFQQHGNLLQITNSPNTIIHWGGFSIGAGEITRFVQQSASSAVLNRVIGQDPSSILGALQSNGRVFLLNPNGILFGAGAQIDVAGLVASTLSLSNADFLAGRLNFTELPGAGSIMNQGSIATPSGGSVYLVAPDVTNSGIITTPKGEVILAAGKSVELIEPGTPNLRVEINAPDNTARNLGQIAAESGRIGIYAGLIEHSGSIQADSAVASGNGRIILKATRNTTLEAGSLTSANGPSGGMIEIQSRETTLVSGVVEAKGGASSDFSAGEEGHGGTIHVLGDKVGLINNARLDVSGQGGGGTILVGGDFQGGNPTIQNASMTYVGPESQMSANAITSGDGGKVIVWSNDATRAYGRILARGGSQSGDGGFAEVSGKAYLDYRGQADLSATTGKVGTLLLDPSDVIIDNSSDSFLGGLFDLLGIFTGAAGTAKITWNTIKSQLATTNTTITTSGSLGTGTITVSANSPDLASANTLRLLAHSNISVNGSISNTGSGSVEMYAGWSGASTTTPTVNPGSGNIALNAPISLSTSVGRLSLIAGDNITQSANGAITANSLLARAGDAVLLDLANNSVSVAAGEVNNCCETEFRLKNTQSLTVGTVGATSGISASDNDGTPAIDVNVTSGSLTISQGVTANGGQISLSAAGAVNVNSNVAAVLSEGPVKITGGSVNVANGVTIGAQSNGGGPSVSLTSTNGGITIQDGAAVHATMSGTSGNGSSVTLSSTGGGITIGNGMVTATGSTAAAGAGGPASVTMISSGGITLNGTNVTATGGGTNDTVQGGGAADVIIAAGGTVNLAGSTMTAAGGVNPGGPDGLGYVGIEVSTGSGNAAAGGNIVIHNIISDNIAIQQSSVTAASGNSVLRASLTSLMKANQIGIEVDAISGASIGTAAEPLRIQANRLEAYTTAASPGIFIESPNPGSLQIGGLDFFNGAVKGVQNLTSGSIMIAANTGGSGQQLTLKAGGPPSPSLCGAGASGGPVCTTSGDVTLRADDMDFGNVVRTGSGTVTLTPYATNRNITILSPLQIAPLALNLFTSELSQVRADTIEIGRSTDAGTLSVNAGLASGDVNAGTLKLAHGNVNINQPIDFSGGSRNLFVTAGAGGAIHQFGSGAVVNGGLTTFNAGGPITLGGANDFGQVAVGAGTDVTLNDTSGIVLNGVTATGALNVTAGGAITQTGAIVQAAGAGPATFDAGANAITLTNAGNDFTGPVSLNNSGANDVSVTDANAILLASSATGTGTFNVDAATTTFAGNFAANNFNLSRGVLSLQPGNTLSLGGTTSIANGATVVVPAGTFDASGGTINVSGIFEAGAGVTRAGAMNILAGGTLRGSGTVTGAVNNTAGTVAPGSSPGILTINGDYVQGPSAVLAVEIGGTIPGTLHDQLRVSGSVTLHPGATLQTTLINGFAPPLGSSYNVIQGGGALTGTFTNTQFAGASGMSVSYSPPNVDVLGPLQTAVTAPLEPQLVAMERVLDVLLLGQTAPGAGASGQDEKPEGLPICR